MPKRKRKSSLSSKQRTKNSSSLLKRPTKTSEPYVKLEKLDEDLTKKYVKNENEDYFDSLLNDYEEDDDLDDSPQLDVKTGEFKTKTKNEDNDIEIIEEVVNVQRQPIKNQGLQMIKLVKIAPKPEVPVKKLKLDPSTGLFHDEFGQEIKIVQREIVKVGKNNNDERKDSNGNDLENQIKIRLAQVGEKHGKLARLQHELPTMPMLNIQRRNPIPVNDVIVNQVQKIGNQTAKILKIDNQNQLTVQLKDMKLDVNDVNNQHCLVYVQGWILTYLTKEDWKILVENGVPIIRSTKFDE